MGRLVERRGSACREADMGRASPRRALLRRLPLACSRWFCSIWFCRRHLCVTPTMLRRLRVRVVYRSFRLADGFVGSLSELLFAHLRRCR